MVLERWNGIKWKKKWSDPKVQNCPLLLQPIPNPHSRFYCTATNSWPPAKPVGRTGWVAVLLPASCIGRLIASCCCSFAAGRRRRRWPWLGITLHCFLAHSHCYLLLNQPTADCDCALRWVIQCVGSVIADKKLQPDDDDTFFFVRGKWWWLWFHLPLVQAQDTGTDTEMENDKK